MLAPSAAALLMLPFVPSCCGAGDKGALLSAKTVRLCRKFPENFGIGCFSSCDAGLQSPWTTDLKEASDFGDHPATWHKITAEWMAKGLSTHSTHVLGAATSLHPPAPGRAPGGPAVGPTKRAELHGSPRVEYSSRPVSDNEKPKSLQQNAVNNCCVASKETISHRGTWQGSS